MYLSSISGQWQPILQVEISLFNLSSVRIRGILPKKRIPNKKKKSNTRVLQASLGPCVRVEVTWEISLKLNYNWFNDLQLICQWFGMHDWSLLRLQIASCPFSFGHLPPLKALPIDLLWWHLSWIGYMYFNFLEMQPQRKQFLSFWARQSHFHGNVQKSEEKKSYRIILKVLADFSFLMKIGFFSHNIDTYPTHLSFFFFDKPLYHSKFQIKEAI